jgi:hypothetical protein
MEPWYCRAEALYQVRIGLDPATSPLDPFCRAWDHPNLFVVDASFLPTSAAVNPALPRTCDRAMALASGLGGAESDAGEPPGRRQSRPAHAGAAMSFTAAPTLRKKASRDPKREDPGHMRRAISKNNKPPTAMPTGQRMKA